jgi:septum formation protein
MLASGSPRRKLLLGELGLKFTVKVSGSDETLKKGTDVRKAASILAKRKAVSMVNEAETHIVITADTIVVVGKEILGKPETREEAIEMISKLSGRSHSVITGVCFAHAGKSMVFDEETKVTFRKLTKEQIAYYVDHYKPFDKAGGYAIQEWIGMVGIKSIEGDYYNVMGLPVGKLLKQLHKFATRHNLIETP